MLKFIITYIQYIHRIIYRSSITSTVDLLKLKAFLGSKTTSNTYTYRKISINSLKANLVQLHYGIKIRVGIVHLIFVCLNTRLNKQKNLFKFYSYHTSFRIVYCVC